MKRILAFILCLILVFSLCSCGVEPGETGETPNFTEAPAVTLPDGSTVYSEEPFVEFPQTGEYKETALLTNVPGQGVPLLLDMREDGTIDYIFAGVEKEVDFQSFVETGACYYTISSDGQAKKQDAEWMTEIDHYLSVTLETTQDTNGAWRFRFAAEEGLLLILAQYHDLRMYKDIKLQNYGFTNATDGSELKGNIQHSVLFKIVDGMVTIVPIDWKFDLNDELIQLNIVEISDLLLADGQIIFQMNGDNNSPNIRTAKFQLNGTLIEAKKRSTFDTNLYYLGIRQPRAGYGKEIPEVLRSMTCYAAATYWTQMDTTSRQYTEDDSLYNLGKFRVTYDIGSPNSYTFHPNMKMIVYGKDRDFCCWFDEMGLGVLMRYDYNPEGKIDPEVVTVWSLEPIDLIETAVAEWNHTHASPIFRYETIDDALDGTYQTLEDELTRLNLELLNGKGPDVMILDGLDVDKYKEFMVPLNGLNTEGVYESIKERFSAGDDLLALPARMTPYLLGRLAEGTQHIDSLTQFADLITTSTDVLDVESIGAGLLKFSGMYNVSDYVQLFRLWYPAWADAIWADGKLNKDVFKEFLTQTNRLSEYYTMPWNNELWWPDVYTFEELKEHPNSIRIPYLHLSDTTIDAVELIPNAADRWVIPYDLEAQGHVGLFTYWLYREDMENDTQSVAHYIESIPGPDGSGTMLPTVITGVRAGGNEKAGLEFVQLLLSAEMQQGLGYYCPPLAEGYPVTWSDTEALIKHLEDYMGQTCTVENSFEETLNNLRTTVLDPYLLETTMDVARLYYRGAPTQEELDDRYPWATWEAWKALTLDEAVEMLYERTRIYLAEKR